METRDRVRESILKAIDEHNAGRGKNDPLGHAEDTVLLGEAAKIDSIGLLHLIVAVEENIEDQFGLSVSVADERAVAQEKSPFRTIATLTEYIAMLVDEGSGGGQQAE